MCLLPPAKFFQISLDFLLAGFSEIDLAALFQPAARGLLSASALIIEVQNAEVKRFLALTIKEC